MFHLFDAAYPGILFYDMIFNSFLSIKPHTKIITLRSPV